MPVSPYIRRVRAQLGSSLLLLPAVAAVIRDEQGRVLVLRTHAHDQWSLPAGGIEPGERPEDAVYREVFEETGLTVTQTTLRAVFGGEEFRVTYTNGDRVEYTVCVFECAVASRAIQFRDGEAYEAQWCIPREVPQLLDLPYPMSLFVLDSH